MVCDCGLVGLGFALWELMDAWVVLSFGEAGGWRDCHATKFYSAGVRVRVLCFFASRQATEGPDSGQAASLAIL